VEIVKKLLVVYETYVSFSILMEVGMIAYGLEDGTPALRSGVAPAENRRATDDVGATAFTMAPNVGPSSVVDAEVVLRPRERRSDPDTGFWLSGSTFGVAVGHSRGLSRSITFKDNYTTHEVSPTVLCKDVRRS